VLVSVTLFARLFTEIHGAGLIFLKPKHSGGVVDAFVFACVYVIRTDGRFRFSNFKQLGWWLSMEIQRNFFAENILK